MKLIDTHCHLDFKDFDSDRDEIIGRCLDNDIYMINVGVDHESSKKSISLAEKHKGVYLRSRTTRAPGLSAHR